MTSPAFASVHAVASATGTITASFEAIPVGQTWQVALVIPTAPATGKGKISVNGAPMVPTLGDQPSAALELANGAILSFAGTGFTAGKSYALNLVGSYSTGPAQGLVPNGPSILSQVSFSGGTINVETATGTSLTVKGNVTVSGNIGSVNTINTITQVETIVTAGSATGKVPSFSIRTVSAQDSIGGDFTSPANYGIATCATDHVAIIKMTGGTLVHTVSVPTATGNIVTTLTGNKAFVVCSTGYVRVVTIFHGKTLGAIQVGANPTSITITPDNKYVLVCNKTSATVSVITVTNQTVSKTVAVGANPVTIAVTQTNKYAIVACSTGGRAYIINLSTWVVAYVPVISCNKVTTCGQYGIAAGGSTVDILTLVAASRVTTFVAASVVRKLVSIDSGHFLLLDTYTLTKYNVPAGTQTKNIGVSTANAMGITPKKDKVVARRTSKVTVVTVATMTKLHSTVVVGGSGGTVSITSTGKLALMRYTGTTGTLGLFTITTGKVAAKQPSLSHVAKGYYACSNTGTNPVIVSGNSTTYVELHTFVFAAASTGAILRVVTTITTFVKVEVSCGTTSTPITLAGATCAKGAGLKLTSPTQDIKFTYTLTYTKKT